LIERILRPQRLFLGHGEKIPHQIHFLIYSLHCQGIAPMKLKGWVKNSLSGLTMKVIWCGKDTYGLSTFSIQIEAQEVHA